MSSSNRHSCMHHEQWIFCEDFSVFGQIENLRMNNIMLWRHLHQILVKQAGRNFITALRVNSRLITHAGMNESEIYNYTCTNRFNFWIINSFMEYWGVCLTWLDCKPSGSKSTLYEVALAILINKLKGNISAVFFLSLFSEKSIWKFVRSCFVRFTCEYCQFLYYWLCW